MLEKSRYILAYALMLFILLLLIIFVYHPFDTAYTRGAPHPYPRLDPAGSNISESGVNPDLAGSEVGSEFLYLQVFNLPIIH